MWAFHIITSCISPFHAFRFASFIDADYFHFHTMIFSLIFDYAFSFWCVVISSSLIYFDAQGSFISIFHADVFLLSFSFLFLTFHFRYWFSMPSFSLIAAISLIFWHYWWCRHYVEVLSAPFSLFSFSPASIIGKAPSIISSFLSFSRGITLSLFHFLQLSPEISMLISISFLRG